MRSFSTRLACAVALLAITLVASGCTGTWTGKGKEVAAAIEKSSTVKTARFSASIEIKILGLPAQAGGQESFVINMSGLGDKTDPNNPRMVMEISSPSIAERERIIMPGDGRVYVTKNGKSYSFPSPTDPAQYAVENGRIMAALGVSVGGFRESQPMTNMRGKSIPAVYATVDKDKLCGPVLDAFGEAFKTSANEGGDDMAKTFGSDPAQGIQGLCKTALRKDPSIWFGINKGLLTDVALSANLAMPMGMTMSMTMQYHESKQGKRIGKIRVPAVVTQLSSEEEFKQVR